MKWWRRWQALQERAAKRLYCRLRGHRWVEVWWRKGRIRMALYRCDRCGVRDKADLQIEALARSSGWMPE